MDRIVLIDHCFVKSSSQRNDEEDEIEVDCMQTGKSQKSQKELSQDDLKRKVCF